MSEAFSEEHVEQLVNEALDELPDDISGLMTNVTVTVEDESPRGPNFVALYEGIPWGRRGPYYAGALPDKITIYRVPLERISGGDPERLRALVRRTSSTRSRTTSGSATSGWSISTATSSRRTLRAGSRRGGSAARAASGRRSTRPHRPWQPRPAPPRAAGAPATRRCHPRPRRRRRARSRGSPAPGRSRGRSQTPAPHRRRGGRASPPP